MTQPLSQQQLESYLWGGATLLRGLIDASDYKQYIFPLLFFKRLSDVWDEEYAAALSETNDDAYARASANDRFEIPEGAHWKDVRNASRDVGRALLTAFRAIETANPERLSGIFGSATWTDKAQMPDETLKNLIEHFSTQTLSLANVPEDELGNGYEYLIKQFADDSGHTAQEFYTNRTLVHLMAQMLEPKASETVYDPTCGTGGMLLSCLAEVKRQGGDVRTIGLYGQELIHITAAIARMNLVLHGVEDFQIVSGNTLRAPAFVEGDRLKTFDVVLANPPYSIKTWNREAWLDDPWGRNRFGAPPQAAADLVFVQHILASMNPGTGRSITLLPHGFLGRASETEVRAALIESDLIEAVIGLGRGLFYNAGMESCLLVCRAKKRPEQKGKILFIDASEQIHKDRSNSFLLPSHQERILQAFRAFRDEEGFASVVEISKIRESKHSLGIAFYVRRSNGEEEGDLRGLWQGLEETSSSFWSEMRTLTEELDQLLGSEKYD